MSRDTTLGPRPRAATASYSRLATASRSSPKRPAYTSGVIDAEATGRGALSAAVISGLSTNGTPTVTATRAEQLS